MRGIFCVFFFQAEDGIRDLVRSRGLGDVYKRQDCRHRRKGELDAGYWMLDAGSWIAYNVCCQGFRTVSYTHLTLPTSDLV